MQQGGAHTIHSNRELSSNYSRKDVVEDGLSPGHKMQVGSNTTQFLSDTLDMLLLSLLLPVAEKGDIAEYVK